MSTLSTAPTAGSGWADALNRLRATAQDNPTEFKWLGGISAVFLLVFFMPVGAARFDNAILEGLALSGFRKLVVLNGHGGNTDSNNVVGLDFVNRLGHEVTIATGAYWDIARAALVEKGLMPNSMIPGHAGRFETSMVMGIRPELVDPEGLKQVRDVSQDGKGLFADLSGATMQVHGAWGASTGYTDNPAAASAQEGKQLMEVVVQRVRDFFVAFNQAA